MFEIIKKTLDYVYYFTEILFYRIPFMAKLYIRLHTPAVKKEIALSNISESDKVLHIGCGAIPYTAKIIAQEKKVKVVGIDNKTKIVNMATNFIKKYPCSDFIKIE